MGRFFPQAALAYGSLAWGYVQAPFGRLQWMRWTSVGIGGGPKGSFGSGVGGFASATMREVHEMNYSIIAIQEQ